MDHRIAQNYKKKTVVSQWRWRHWSCWLG